jgi:hypothetical protein
MDLALYSRVLWRFKILVIGGLIAAIGLSTMAVVRVSFAHGFGMTYRQNQEFVSNATLFVTQEGFPWGYAAPPIASTTPAAAVKQQSSQLGTKEFADPNRFPSLATLYSYLATSDPVKEIMLRDKSILGPDGKIDGIISSLPVVATQFGYGVTLPLVAISGISTTPEKAQALALRATDAFRLFLESQQARNRIPSQNRVLVTVLQRADKPRLLKGRSKTLPLVVFVTVMIAIVGLAFLLENLRPRVTPAATDELARLPVVSSAPGQQSA